ncbi:hypothetical protein A0J61_09016 [Choanephora cucurbitarum]|uniref:Uncharacterized protein n=1 Tax=Choanephora cucurbitarum TaxID=101091 RepID=A0A1C7N1F7_9FUNG|nr:hypothetical protein A0J61_09016 [Choanephora cucurbitarum]
MNEPETPITISDIPPRSTPEIRSQSTRSLQRAGAQWYTLVFNGSSTRSRQSFIEDWLKKTSASQRSADVCPEVPDDTPSLPPWATPCIKKPIKPVTPLNNTEDDSSSASHSVSSSSKDSIDQALYQPHAAPYIDQDFKDDASHDTLPYNSDQYSEDSKTEPPYESSANYSLSDDLPDFQSPIHQQEINTTATNSYHTAITQPVLSDTEIIVNQSDGHSSTASVHSLTNLEPEDDLYELDELSAQDFLAIEDAALRLQKRRASSPITEQQPPEKKQQL